MSMKKYLRDRIFSCLQGRMKPNLERGLQMEPLEDRNLLTATPNGWDVVDTPDARVEYGFVASSETPSEVKLKFGEYVGTDDLVVGVVVSGKTGGDAVLDPAAITLDAGVSGWQIVKSGMLSDAGGTNSSFVILRVTPNEEGYDLFISGKGEGRTGAFTCSIFTPGSVNKNGIIDDFEIEDTFKFVTYTNAYLTGGRNPASIDMYRHMFGENVDISRWDNVYSATYDINMDGVMTSADLSLIKMGIRDTSVVKLEYDHDPPVVDPEWIDPANPKVINYPADFKIPLIDDTGVQSATVKINGVEYDAVLADGGTTPEGKRIQNITGVIVDEQPVSFEDFFRDSTTGELNNGDYTMTVTAVDNAGNEMSPTDVYVRFIAAVARETPTNETTYNPAWSFGEGAALTALEIGEGNSAAVTWDGVSSTIVLPSGVTVQLTLDGNGHITSMTYVMNGRWDQQYNLPEGAIDPVTFTMTNIEGETGIWVFNVYGVNDAPEAHADVQIAIVDTETSGSKETNATDRDRGDILTAKVLSTAGLVFKDAPEGIGRILPTGVMYKDWLTWDSETGRYVFNVPGTFLERLPLDAKLIITYTCEVTDKLGATTNETVVVTVTGTNQAPTANAIDETYAGVSDASTPIVLDIPFQGSDIDFGDTVTLGTVTIGGVTYTVDWATGKFDSDKTSVDVAGYGSYTLDTVNQKLLYTLTQEYSDQLRWSTPAGESVAIELGGLQYAMIDNHGALSENASVSYTYVGAFDKLQFVSIPDQEVNALATESGWKTLDHKITFHSDSSQEYTFSIASIASAEHTLDSSLLRFGTITYGLNGSVEVQVDGDKLASIPSDWFGDYTVTFDYANTDTASHPTDAGRQTFKLSIIGYTLEVTPSTIAAGTLTENDVYTEETRKQVTVNVDDNITSVIAYKSGGATATVDSYDFSTVLRLTVSGPGTGQFTEEQKAILLSCASIDSDGNFLFRLSGEASDMLQYLAEGDALTLTFGYSLTNLVIDSQPVSGSLRGGDLTVMITGVNDGPVPHGTVNIALSDVDATASAPSKVTDVDTPLSELEYTLAAIPTVTFSEGAPEGIESIIPDGATFEDWLTWDASQTKYVFTPKLEIFKALPENVNATLTYTFQVSDGKGGTAYEEVAVTITGTNQAPTAERIDVEAGAGETVVVDWLASASDIDYKDPITLVKINDVNITADASHPQTIELYDGGDYVGKLTITVINGEQVLTYTANGDALKWDLAEGVARSVSFTYQVSDSRLPSNTADAEVKVTGKFDPLEADPENPEGLKVTNKSAAIEGWIPVTEQLDYFRDMLPGGQRENYQFTVTKVNGDAGLAEYFKMEVSGGSVTLFVRQDAVTGDRPILPPNDYTIEFSSENIDGFADIQNHKVILTIQDKSGVEADPINLDTITEDTPSTSKDLSDNTFIDPDNPAAVVTDVRFKTMSALPIGMVTLTDSTGTYIGEQIRDYLGWTPERFGEFLDNLSTAASVDGAASRFTFTNNGFLDFLAAGSELGVIYNYTIDGYTSDGVVWDVPSADNAISLTITGVNDAPYGAVDHIASVDLTTEVVMYDDGKDALNIFDGVTDPEGRPLSTTWKVPATVTAYDTTFTLSDGAITVDANGNVTINTKNLISDFIRLGLGQSAEVVVKFTISDDLGIPVAEGERSLTVTVAGKNDTPTKKADAPTGSDNIEESTSSSPVSITPAIFAEDIDLNDTTLYFQSVTVDGQTITVETSGWVGNTITRAFNSGATLTLIKDANGIISCSYNVAGRAERVPNLPVGVTAADPISFVIRDKAGATTESFDYNFNVIGVNDAPYGVVDHSSSVDLIDQEVTYDDGKATLNLLDGVIDPDGNDLSVEANVPTSVTVDGHTFEISSGAISVAANGVVSIDIDKLTSDFIPLAQDATANFDVTFLVKDSEGKDAKEGPKTLTITIIGRNEAPTVSTTVTGTVDLAAGEQTTLDLTSGATDPDIGDTVSSAVVSSITYDDGGVIKSIPEDCWSLTDSKTVVFDIAKLRAFFSKLAIGSSVELSVSFNVVDSYGASSDAATALVTVNGWYEAPRFVTDYAKQTTNFAYVDGTHDGILSIALSGHFTGAYIPENTTATLYSTAQGGGKIADLAYVTDWTDVAWEDGSDRFVGQYRMVTDGSGNVSIELKMADCTSQFSAYGGALNTSPIFAQIKVSDDDSNVAVSNLFQVELAEDDQCSSKLLLLGTNDATGKYVKSQGTYRDDYQNIVTDVDTLGNYDPETDTYWYYLEVWYRNTSANFTGIDFTLTQISFQLNQSSSNIESIHIWDDDDENVGIQLQNYATHSDLYTDNQVNVNEKYSYDLGDCVRAVSLSSTKGVNMGGGTRAYLVARLKVTVKATTSQTGTKCMADHSIKMGAVTDPVTPFVAGLNIVRQTTSEKINNSQIRLNDGVVVPQRVIGLSGTEVIVDNGVYLRTVTQATNEQSVDTTLVSNTEYLHEWQSHYTEVWVKASELETYLGAAAQFSFMPGYFTATNVEFGSMFGDGTYSIDAENGLITVSALAADGAFSSDGLFLLARVTWQSGSDNGVAWSASVDPVNLSWEITAADLYTLSGNTDVSIGVKQSVELWANPYDTDDDGLITDTDLVNFLLAYGHGVAGEYYTIGSDYDRNGAVDDTDLLYFLSIYGVSKEDVVSGRNTILLPETFTRRYVGTTLSTDQMELVGNVFDAANQAWAEALGLDDTVSVTLAVKDFADAETLAQAQVTQTDVNGEVKSGIIYLDDDAAGRLWYSQMSDPVDASRYDLYTVLLHELGHFYGYDPSSTAYTTVSGTLGYLNAEGHSDDIADVMYYGVEVGQRKELTDQDIAASRTILDVLREGDVVGSSTGDVSAMTVLLPNSPIPDAAVSLMVESNLVAEGTPAVAGMPISLFDSRLLQSLTNSGLASGLDVARVRSRDESKFTTEQNAAIDEIMAAENPGQMIDSEETYGFVENENLEHKSDEEAFFTGDGLEDDLL